MPETKIATKDRKFKILHCYGRNGEGFFEEDYSSIGPQRINHIFVTNGDDLVRKTQFITDSKAATILDITSTPHVVSRKDAVSVTDGVIGILNVDDGKMVTVISGYPLVDKSGNMMEPTRVVKFTGRKVGVFELGSMKTPFVMFDVKIGPERVVMISTFCATTAVLSYEGQPVQEDIKG